MTRFARAKGSKSSNARTAEEATSWNEFQRQIGDKKADLGRQEDLSVARSALKRIKEGSNTETGWADFGPLPHQNVLDKASKKRKTSDDSIQAEVHMSKKKAKKLRNEEGTFNEKTVHETEEKSETNNQVPIKKTKKSLTESGTSNEKSMVKVEEKSESNSYLSKKKSKKTQMKADSSNEKNVDEVEGTNKSVKQTHIPESSGKRQNKEFKRRKPFIESSTLNINGISINISKFDGFDVQTEDAVRLKELRSKMLKEGIPRVEVDKVMKLERRKAEKALTRAKKKVCFNCRKAGHLLSECPEIGSSSGSKNFDTSAGTMCYKCGSTEHTHYQCQVKKKKEYSFATCFICKEQGHISSQCPDNPRGLYPQGGSCKVCGEVTHLKKDCPQLSKEKEESAITLGTISSGRNLESLGEDVEAPKVKKQFQQPAGRQNKIIKF